MTDYAKKTVAELTEILKSKGLPHSGKKAELVARLTEADKTEPEPAPAPKPKSVPAPAPAPASAPEVPPPSDTSTAVPTAPAPSAPPTSTHQDAKATSSAEGAPSPDTALASQTYALNLPSSSVDDEMKKRQARAARFGTAAAETGGEKETDAQKNLDRAKRFGTGQTAVGKLDEALPMEREKGRKRMAEGSALDDPGLKSQGPGKKFRGGRGGRTNSGRDKGDRPTGVAKTAPAYIGEKDRLAAEARKKKFATA